MDNVLHYPHLDKISMCSPRLREKFGRIWAQVSDWNNAILNGPDFLRNSFKEQCLPNDLVQGTTSGIVAHAIWFILIQLLRTEDMHDKTGH